MKPNIIPHGFIAFYPCRDLAASRDFYERSLRLELIRDQTSCLIFKVAQEAYIGFCQAEETASNPKVILTFLTDEVDQAYQRLRSLGVETEAPPKHNEAYQIYHFFARDPDQYRIEIQRFDVPLENP